MTGRERVKLALEHKEPDRVPIHDSPWAATIERWKREGMPADANPHDYFGYEIAGFGADTSPRFPVEILKETDEYIIARDSFGGVRKNWRDYTSTPEIIDWPVKTKEDWLRIKERLTPSEDRVNWEWLEQAYKYHKEKGRFITYDAAVGYDKLQSYIFTPHLLMLIIDDPEWVIDMYETDAKLAMDMCDIMMKKGYQFDGAFLYCDLGYRNGPLFSPRHFKEQLHPVFKTLCDFFHKRGMFVLLHSCGNVAPLIDFFIEEGIDCLQPLEVKAGMDLIELKKKYGDRIAFMGGIDVRAMAAEDPRIIEDEIKRKFEVAMVGGGYIYHSDHSVPNNVSFEQYKRVMELVHKYGTYRK
ncbi:hypothetical protein H5T87_03515 [bacterium]|nr:hypothetical protein [bacterium]